MSFTIKTAEGEVVAIEEDYGNAEELRMFLNEVAEADGAEPYTLTETTKTDIVMLAAEGSAIEIIDIKYG